MMSEFSIDVNSVQICPGGIACLSPERICMPYMNVGMYIGNETPFVWPPEVLREAATGTPLLTPDGQPLFVAG